MSLLTHVLACLFGMGSWVAINGMWVELPLVVPEIPEGWYLPSYLTVIVQMANVGPLFITLMHRFRPGALDERPVVYCIVTLGVAATFLLAFFWNHSVVLGGDGARHSVPLLVLSFLLSVVDCTSSVTFLPFMMRLGPQFLTSYFVGEGLSGLVPALVALVQGVGLVHCRNATAAVAVGGTTLVNSTPVGGGGGELEAVYQPANFSAQVFFIFLSAMMAVCLGAFVLLNHHPAVVRERKGHRYLGEEESSEDKRAEQALPMLRPQEPPVARERRSAFGMGTYSRGEVAFIFLVLAWVNALTNAVLPAVQSYSCLPYGNQAYHLAATMAAVANPVACFIAIFTPIRSLLFMLFLTAVGSSFGAYIMAVAAFSPCPPLVHSPSGVAVIVISWILFVLTLSYVKVIIGVILRDEGHSALVWCGAVVQLGSMIGAVSMFPLVSVYGLFKSGDPCNTKCPS